MNYLSIHYLLIFTLREANIFLRNKLRQKYTEHLEMSIERIINSLKMLVLVLETIYLKEESVMG